MATENSLREEMGICLVRLRNSRVSIRRAIQTDAVTISVLIRRNADAVLSADYTLEQLNAWKQYNTPAHIRQRLRERETFCAVDSRQICGTIALQENELVGLYVSPRWRARGIGRILLEHLEMFAAKQGMTKLHLTSTPSAVEFYRHYGWKRRRKIVLNIGGIEFEETLMTKDLAQTKLKCRVSHTNM